MTETFLPLNQLRLGQDIGINARRIGDAADLKDITASLKANGVLIPLLIYVEDEIGYVVDGSRRLRGLLSLLDVDQVPPGLPVPVRDGGFKNRAEALAASVIANGERSDMHPVDLYEAVSKLAAEGMTEADIAAVLIMPRKAVKQAQALSRIAPPILEAWRAGKVAADVAQAFTVCPDLEKQAEVFERLSKNHNLQAYYVKNLLTADTPERGNDIEFIGGVKAAKKAGVLFLEDLFGDSKYVSNPELLTELVDKKFGDQAAALLEDGWKWAVRNEDEENYYRHRSMAPANLLPTDEETARLEELRTEADDAGTGYQRRQELREEINAINLAIRGRSYTAEEKAIAGCVLFTAGSSIRIDYGRVRPADEPAVDPASAAIAGVEERGPKVEPDKPDSKEPKALLDVLRQVKTDAIAAAIATDTIEFALSVAVASMLSEGFRTGGGPVHISTRGSVSADAIPDLVRPPEELETYGQILTWALDLDLATLNLAFCQQMGQCVDATTRSMYDPMSGNHKSVRWDAIAALAGNLAGEPFQGALTSRFDPALYCASARKAQVMAAVEEAKGKDAVKALKKLKGEEFVAKAAADLQGTGWLPLELRLGEYQGPGAAAPAAPSEVVEGADADAA